MKFRTYFCIFLLSVILMGCASNRSSYFSSDYSSELINENLNNASILDEKLYQDGVPTYAENLKLGGYKFDVTIIDEYKYESQQFFLDNLFNEFDHSFIYDNLYYDSFFPNSTENDYSLKNRESERFTRAFTLSINEYNVTSDNREISTDVEEAMDICKSKPFVKSVHKGTKGIASSSNSKRYERSLTFNKWWLDRVDAQSAWQYTRGSSSIKIGILDDGIQYDHPNIGNLNISLSECFDLSLAEGAELNPVMEHGTGIAGVITGKATNTYPLFEGIAKNCEIVSLRILDNEDNLTYPTALEDAIEYATINNIDILVLSYCLTQSELSIGAIYKIVNFDGIIFCAAGNDYFDIDNPPSRPDEIYSRLYPSVSSFSNVVSITSSNNNDECIGNFGTSVSFAAPGTDIWTTTLNSSLSCENGSSYSTPIVAGAFALLKSYFPCMNNYDLLDILINYLDYLDVNPSDNPVLFNSLYSLYNSYYYANNGTHLCNDGCLNIGDAFDALSSHKVYTSISATQHHISCNCLNPYNYGNENHDFELVNVPNNLNYIPYYECSKCHYSTYFPVL